ncbi:MAG: N-acyl homoserine lactonase family protein [Rhodospirillum sp.]|nr:N-acyl homoserine lactonase family protein [Rhodospirillum sp.]MCF8490551.1 N-acyl homoserine lactonase family protein [Rhodospirillum sp.]MCF8500597.1 N-acyl homoserine lactonase family protein [Rhodospirillum sp.]
MNVWDILAIRYAHVDLPRSSCFLGEPKDGAMQRLDFYFWILTGGGSPIVVDMGFNAEVAARRRRVATLPPDRAFSLLNIDPDRVERVVMTHLHYDHAGNSDLFSKARFTLRAKEMAFATGPAMNDAATAHHYAADDIRRFVRLLHDGRLDLIDGDDQVEIAPGVTVHAVPGHTDGLQVVRVTTRGGPVVIASDACHYYASMRDGKPFPTFTDPRLKLIGYERLKALADGGEGIVAAHDPEVLRLFPDRAGHPDIVRIAGEPAFPLVSAAPFLSNARTEFNVDP